MQASRVYAASATIGLVAGLRSMMAPAVVSHVASNGALNLDGSPLAFLASERASIPLAVLAGGEVVADKTPWIPNRTDPPALIARVVTGGLSGAAVAIGGRRDGALGAVIGGLAALGGTFLGFQLRRRAVREGGLPDPVVAVCEDLIAMGAAAGATRAVAQ